MELALFRLRPPILFCGDMPAIKQLNYKQTIYPVTSCSFCPYFFVSWGVSSYINLNLMLIYLNTSIKIVLAPLLFEITSARAAVEPSINQCRLHSQPEAAIIGNHLDYAATQCICIQILGYRFNIADARGMVCIFAIAFE